MTESAPGSKLGQGDRRAGRDFTRIGETSEPAFVRLPAPSTDFAARAVRLAALAEGSPLAPYLAFLSRIVAVQHAAQEALPPVRPLPEAWTSQCLAHGMPPLSKDVLAEDESLADTLEWFSRHAAVPDVPEAAEQARARLAAMAAPARLALAEAVFEAAYPLELLGESLYVAAALQAHLARQAARLDAARLRPVGDGACPACGAGPVASVIVGWASASRSRYCCCSLCGTMWNYVRIKCAACGSTAGISYYAIEEGPRSIAVETCTTCRSYVKHLDQHEDALIDPFADDVASFGLDVLVQEKGFHRVTANPLMVVPPRHPGPGAC